MTKRDVTPGAYGIPPVPASTPGALVCGACGRAWLRDITPASRCPWEHEHTPEPVPVTRGAWGFTAETPDDEMPTCPNCGPEARMFGQYYRTSDGPEYDVFTCHECGADYNAEDLDASSGYRQAVIEGDAVAERIRAQVERAAVPMDHRLALASIAVLLDGQEWDAETLDRIAELCRLAGFQVRDVDG